MPMLVDPLSIYYKKKSLYLYIIYKRYLVEIERRCKFYHVDIPAGLKRASKRMMKQYLFDLYDALVLHVQFHEASLLLSKLPKFNVFFTMLIKLVACLVIGCICI